MAEERVPWNESNLALIGSDLDHKIKAAAADQEDAWDGIGESPGTRIWRIESFTVQPWPEFQYGQFHKGDSYIVLNSYVEDDSDKLNHDVHIWIGSESSQDEYGTAAYKMVECDEKLGGAAIQHRQVQGNECPMFQSYFNSLTYLEGGVESGFNHVEPTKDTPHLYKIKGTDKGMSLTQVPLETSSLNGGDSFILFANHATVWIWHGAGANPDEKAKANQHGETMCSEGTVTVLDQGDGDAEHADFWGYLNGNNGDIAEADDDDDAVDSFAPLVFQVMAGDDEEPLQVAKGEPVTVRWGNVEPKLDRASILDEGNIYILDAGWEIFLWMGSEADRGEKLNSMTQADAYCKQDPRTAHLPLTICKSGMESHSFNNYFN